jgi:putative restriction endonuclease
MSANVELTARELAEAARFGISVNAYASLTSRQKGAYRSVATRRERGSLSDEARRAWATRLTPRGSDRLASEVVRREGMWAALLAAGGPDDVEPGLLRELGIYGGAQGVWVDAARTASVTGGSSGVTVAVLHTGTSYPDDLSEEGLVYHYPATTRPRRRDANEIEATKQAGWLRVPIFAVLFGETSSSLRRVRRAWVERWSDREASFLIAFSDRPTPQEMDPNADTAPAEDGPFFLTATAEERKGLRKIRPGQSRFRFEVAARYGQMCAVCAVAVPQVLEAAHICEKQTSGSDDWRNGLMLCATHHRAFDRGLWAIDPTALAVVVRKNGPSEASLGITKRNLSALRSRPHRAALDWAWARWIAATRRSA